MGVGLGKNSPVVLSQNRVNFEALIDRHGQWLRWRTTRKCTCVTTENEPNVHCEKCNGSGDIYDYQKFYTDTLQLKVRDNVLDLPVANAECEVIQIYDTYGNDYPFVKCGGFVEITGGPRKLSKNEIVGVLIRDTTVKHLDSVELERVGGGYYRVPGIETTPSKIDGVYYKSAGDVIAVERLETTEHEAVEIAGYRQNLIQVDPGFPESETLTAYGVDYIMPFKFILLSQNLNKEDSQLVSAHNGDAVCTYPYMFNVSENDVLTVLSGNMPGKVVLNHISDESDDIIPEFFVAEVDNLETQEEKYQEGIDFILAGTNRIHWLGENKPAAGAVMSINYQYRPTYRVAKNIPMLRTSEDQHIPRKVVLKLFAAFAEGRRLNQNG
ncbi:hypothetical protein AGMMS49944_19690 [Spirochaetia bacterium]|nr:hypothetical protein AGMMS49944_19690 [Spirochaetia bacterium]